MRLVTCEEMQSLATMIQADIQKLIDAQAADIKSLNEFKKEYRDSIQKDINAREEAGIKVSQVVAAINKLAAIKTENVESCKTGEVLSKTIDKDFDFKSLEIK